MLTCTLLLPGFFSLTVSGRTDNLTIPLLWSYCTAATQQLQVMPATLKYTEEHQGTQLAYHHHKHPNTVTHTTSISERHSVTHFAGSTPGSMALPLDGRLVELIDQVLSTTYCTRVVTSGASIDCHHDCHRNNKGMVYMCACQHPTAQCAPPQRYAFTPNTQQPVRAPAPQQHTHAGWVTSSLDTNGAHDTLSLCKRRNRSGMQIIPCCKK